MLLLFVSIDKKQVDKRNQWENRTIVIQDHATIVQVHLWEKDSGTAMWNKKRARQDQSI